MSTRLPYGCLLSTSGALYTALPTAPVMWKTEPRLYLLGVLCAPMMLGSGLANPKSTRTAVGRTRSIPVPLTVLE